MSRFLIFDYAYGDCKGDTDRYFTDGAAHEIDAVREYLIRLRRYPVRFDRIDIDGKPPANYSECYVVFSVPLDSPIDSHDLNYYENDEYIKRRGGELCGLVFTFDSLQED